MRRRTGSRGARLVMAVLAAAVLTACGGGGYHPAGPFRPLPEGAPPEVGPPPSQTAPAPRAPDQPAEPGAGPAAGDPNVVASGLSVPTGLALLPDGSAVVGERDTGRLLQVFPDRTPARELMTVAGIDTAGDGGLLGLALSPTFVEDGLLYAYVSTATDNRVVRFPIGGTPNPVLTGIPRGEVHNGGGLAFGPDGNLFVGTGDAGNPALAADPASLAGKVLRVTVFGAPVGAGPVFSRGFRDVTALCPSVGDQKLYATDDATGGPDELNAIVEDKDYGQPGSGPVIDFPADQAGLGGCTASGGTVFLGALDGQQVHVVPLDPSGAVTDQPKDLLTGQYGRLRTVVLDAQGALWVTTSNRDGIGTPAADDDKVLRILPPTSQGSSQL